MYVCVCVCVCTSCWCISNFWIMDYRIITLVRPYVDNYCLSICLLFQVLKQKVNTRRGPISTAPALEMETQQKQQQQKQQKQTPTSSKNGVGREENEEETPMGTPVTPVDTRRRTFCKVCLDNKCLSKPYFFKF